MMKNLAVLVVTVCVCVDVMMAVPVNYPQYSPMGSYRYRRQDQMQMNDPRMVQYQQILQARQAQELRRAQMSAGQFVPSQATMNAALGPLMAQQQEQLPYDRSNMGIPRLSMQPLPLAPAQLPPDLRQQVPPGAAANQMMAQQATLFEMAAAKQKIPAVQQAAVKAKIPQTEEQREAMEMFNEKVDLGLFVNNDIQPNVVMMEGKRSDMPAATDSTNTPLTDDDSEHEIAKKSDISKAKDSSPTIVNELTASTKADATPVKSKSPDTNTESRDNKIDNKTGAPAPAPSPVRVQDEEEKRSVKNTVTCQGEKEWLQCPTYHLIKIHSAFWGRDDSKACTRSGIQHALSTEKTCAQDESNTMLKVQNSCDGENVCEVVASPLFFDRNDCPETYKFLRLNWECARSESRIKENLDRDAPKLEKKDTIPSDMVSADDLLATEKIAESEVTESKPVEISMEESTVEEKKPVQKEIDSNDVTRRDGIESDTVLHRDADYEKSISEVMVADSSADSGTGFAVQDGDSADLKKKEADLMKNISAADTKGSVADAGSGDQAPSEEGDKAPVVADDHATASNDTTIAETASNDTSSTETASNDTSSVESASNDTSSAETASNDTSSAETASNDTPSAETASNDTSNAETASNNTSSAETASNDTSSAETASNDTSSAETASNDTSSAETAANVTAAGDQKADGSDSVSKSDTAENADEKKPAAATTTAADTGSGSASSDLMEQTSTKDAGSGDKGGDSGDAAATGEVKKSSVMFV